MHPMTGLDLDEEAAHYMPEERLTTWDEYDAKIEVNPKAISPLNPIRDVNAAGD